MTNVMLEISAPGHDLGFSLGGGGCTRETAGLFCESLRLGGGESREVTALAMARRVGLDQDSRAIPLQVQLHVTTQEDLQRTDQLFFTPSRCVRLIGGTEDISTGRALPIRSAVVAERTRSILGSGKDRVSAGAGPDVIYTRDGYRDVIACGLGRDLVIADRKDKVGRDCERVRRR